MFVGERYFEKQGLIVLTKRFPETVKNEDIFLEYNKNL